MKNNFITKIIGATLAFAMMIGGAVGIFASQEAKMVDADQTYSNREIAFTASSLPSGLAISNSGGFGSSTYRMANNDYATIDASVLFEDGEVLSSENMSIAAKIGTYNSWSGTKTAKYTVSFLDANGAVLSTATGNSKNGMGNSSSYANGPAVNLSKPSDPSQIAKLKIVFTDLTTPGSGAYLRFQGVQLTYSTETANLSAVTSIALTAENNKTTLDLNDTVQLTAVVKDNNDDPIENAAVAFSSSDPTVASVDSDGLVTASPSKHGSATITASYAGDANHNASQAVIVIRVANLAEPSFVVTDFATENGWEEGVAYATLGTIGSVTITGSGSGNNTKYYPSDESWRFYDTNGKITISTSAGYLKKITLTSNGSHYFTNAPANWSYSNNVFTTSSKVQTSVQLSSGSGTSKIKQIDVQIGYAYTVSYEANGGTGTMTDSNSPYDKNTTVTVLENTFNAPSGMMFDHWNTSANDSGASYDAGDTFAIDANTTLYAQWVSAGNNPYVAGIADSISGVYSGQTQNIAFTYGNFDNEPSLISNNEAVLTVTNIDVDNENDSSATLNFIGAGSTNLLVKDGEDIVKTIPVSVTASTVTITGLASTGAVQVGKTLNLGNTITVTPVGSYSNEVTWESEDDNIATVSEDGVVTGVDLGTVDITVSSVDYPTATMTCAVTVSAVPAENMAKVNSIAVGDVVYLATEATKHQYSGHAGSTVYATGESYSTKPVDTQPGFEVVTGNAENSFAFKVTSGTNADKYITWLSGNSLDVSETLNDNSSWLVTFDGNSNATIKNAKDNSRVIWWNVASPRFASYTGKTDDNSYDSVQLWKLTTPNDYMASATTIRTINGTANYVDETVVSVDSVALRFGASISKDNWDAINAQWKITDYGVMLLKETTLTSYSKASVEAAFRGGETVTNLHRGSGAAPATLGDDYFFTVKINIADDTDYETVYCAAPYIKAGGSYYFFTEMRDSVRTMAGTNPSSSLSAAALAFLAGN